MCWWRDSPEGPLNYGPGTRYSNWSYTDAVGTHRFPAISFSDCPDEIGTYSAYASDGSGYSMYANDTGSASVHLPSGVTINPPVDSSTGSMIDTNGNTISTTGAIVTDSLGTVALTIGTLDPNTYVQRYTYPGPSGDIHTDVTYTPTNIKTNFGCLDSGGSPIGEFTSTGTVLLITQIKLPDNSYYGITYEATPGPSGYSTGRIASIRLPSGGKITYEYTGTNSGISCKDGSTLRLTRKIWKNANDPQPESTWVYARTQSTGSGPNTTIVTSPSYNGASSDTVIEFQNIYETRRRSYSGAYNPSNQGAGLLLTMETCYSSNTNHPVFPCTQTAAAEPFTEVAHRTELTTGKSSQTNTFYNTYGLTKEVDEYDYWTGVYDPPSGPIRKAITTWTTLTGNINRPTEVKVTDGSGNTVARTTYAYDEGSGTAHGNVTTITRYSNSSTSLSEHYTYNANGLVATYKDAGNNQTTYTYGACNNSFLTSVSLSDSISLTRSQTWACGGGVVTTATDENSQTTSYLYEDANRWQPTTINYPGGGQITTSYDFGTSSPWSVSTTQLVAPGQSTSVQSQLDGLGRNYQTIKTASDSTDIIYADTTFDALGRVYSVSNPYISQSDPTFGVTEYSYDALGRPTVVTNPDGTTKQIEYGGAAVTFSDEGYNSSGSPVKRTLQYDALGRLKSACEITAGIVWNGDTGTNCNLDVTASGFTTTYGYDLLGNLTSVTQGSLTSRNYSYDWLGRLTSEANPETGGATGATTYRYNPAGDLDQRVRPKQNQTSTSVKVTTAYSYDALHRLKQISYDDLTTPTVTYNYDETTAYGQTIANGKSRRTSEYVGASPGSSGALFQYDAVGRVTAYRQCTLTTCATPTLYSVTYGYNEAGNVTSVGNPLGYTFAYTYNASQQLTGVTNSPYDSNHPATMAANLAYNPLGQLTSGTVGGLTLSRSYDSMGRLRSLSDGSVYSLSGPGANNTITYYPNSSIRQATDSINGAWTYGYDEFSRLASAAKSGSDSYTTTTTGTATAGTGTSTALPVRATYL